MENCNITEQFKGFLKTPDIFPNNEKNKIKIFEFPEVSITEEIKANLEKLDHPRNSVLGKRMESFLEIAIKHSGRYELISANIQIIQNKRTLGELDFLVFDKVESKDLHVELVYKLYLYDQNFQNGKDRWIGPNRRDSFSQKYEKLSCRQFPLLYQKETREYLKNLNLEPEQIEQRLCFKAQLFLPEDNKDELDINSECLRGKWFSFNQFKKFNWQENKFYSPKKKYWTCDPAANKQWISYSELLQELEMLFEKKKSPLVWMKTANTYAQFFIVWW